MQQLACKLHAILESPESRKRYSWVAIALAVGIWAVTGYAFWEIHKAEKASQSATAALVEALDMSETAIVVSDCDGIVTSANKAAVQLFGGRTVVGEPVHKFCSAEQRNQANLAYQKAMQHVTETGLASVTQMVVQIDSVTGHIDAELVIRVSPRDGDCPLVVAALTPLSKITNIPDQRPAK